MKRIFFIVFSLPLILTPAAYATSSVDVNVNNQSSATSTNDSSVKTDIRVETNGHVTTYSSDKSENIEVKAENDKSEIKVNGVVVSKAPISTPSPETTNIPTPTDEENDDDEDENEDGLLNILKERFNFFEKIFSIFD